jgi:hypothetical protein
MKSPRHGRCGRLFPILTCLILLGACGGGGGTAPAGAGAGAGAGNGTVKNLAVPSQISVVTATE